MSEVSDVMILALNEQPMEDVLESVRNQCDEIIVIKGGSRGWARNEGLRKARNRYVLMIDSDQIFLQIM